MSFRTPSDQKIHPYSQVHIATSKTRYVTKPQTRPLIQKGRRRRATRLHHTFLGHQRRGKAKWYEGHTHTKVLREPQATTTQRTHIKPVGANEQEVCPPARQHKQRKVWIREPPKAAAIKRTAKAGTSMNTPSRPPPHLPAQYTLSVAECRGGERGPPSTPRTPAHTGANHKHMGHTMHHKKVKYVGDTHTRHGGDMVRTKGNKRQHESARQCACAQKHIRASHAPPCYLPPKACNVKCRDQQHAPG